MLKLIKYLKPYTMLILLAIALLFVQAFADLALPDYMARIVNIGIQQGGVEDAVPIVLRKTTMDRVTIFMTDDEKTRVLADYSFIDSQSSDYDSYLEKYPLLAEEPIFVLNSISEDERDWLNPIMGKSVMIVSGIETIMADPEKAA